MMITMMVMMMMIMMMMMVIVLVMALSVLLTLAVFASSRHFHDCSRSSYCFGFALSIANISILISKRASQCLAQPSFGTDLSCFP